MTRFDLDNRVLILAIARMVESMANTLLIVVLPLFIVSGRLSGGTLGLDEALFAGIAIGLFGLISIPVQPFVGRASDRTGRRKVFVLVGLGILAVTNAVYVFADSYLVLLGIRAIQGISVGIMYPVSFALITEYSTDTTRGKNMGIFSTLQTVGLAAGPVLASLVITGGPYTVATLRISGFEAAFYVASGIAVVSTLLVLAFVTDPEELDADTDEDFSIRRATTCWIQCSRSGSLRWL